MAQVVIDRELGILVLQLIGTDVRREMIQSKRDGSEVINITVSTQSSRGRIEERDSRSKLGLG